MSTRYRFVTNPAELRDDEPFFDLRIDSETPTVTGQIGRTAHGDDDVMDISIEHDTTELVEHATALFRRPDDPEDSILGIVRERDGTVSVCHVGHRDDCPPKSPELAVWALCSDIRAAALAQR